MSIQTAPRRAARRTSRATSHCDIWDLIAPELPCPACDGGFAGRLERATQEQGGAGSVAEVDLTLLDLPAGSSAAADDVAQDLEGDAAPAAGAGLPTPDARAEAGALLRLLAH